MTKQKKDIKKTLLSMKAFPEEKYEDLDLDRLTVFSLLVLSKKNIPLYFDYLVVSLFKMFPKKFSMATFNEYPDTYRINNSVRRLTGSLKDEKSSKNWATGSAEHGFHLTEVGIEIAKQTEELIKTAGEKNKKINHKPTRTRGRSSTDDAVEIRDSQAFKKWSSNQSEDVTSYDIFTLLSVLPYTPRSVLKEQLDKFKDSTTTIKDEEARQFLQWVEKRFNNIFN